MVSESTVSRTELSEFFGPHGVPARELSEFLSAYFVVCQSKLTGTHLSDSFCYIGPKGFK